MSEHFVSIINGEHTLSAILHDTDCCDIDTKDKRVKTGVLIVVGGPQYRIGSHRQFVKLSRALAAAGIPSMRFDSAGMGDSTGSKVMFYQQNDDIAAAIQLFMQQCPHLNNIVLWGLCDAASAALLYCYRRADSRVVGLVLLNPWVRQQHSHAQVMLKHYYWQRLSSKAFWQKLLAGGLNPWQSIKDVLQTYKASKSSQPKRAAEVKQPSKEKTTAENYVQHMLAGWQAFAGRTLVITSGNDHTAQEFLDLCAHNPAWEQCLARAQHHHVTAANHTFATTLWRGEVEQQTAKFVRQ
ncbi:MAG: hydrolase 1, exosortase A system-associated [Rheinheimera sp.]|uniref:hydrolase 1, exosortase A system-associated n=1 Tax=Arsukibacterium sp. UBA3155 TaxID=1946058 RepID=UPI000C944685|nr:hydrolase 1, exosortase A system-associated [Arsukibacterium sp. UBA3155]MAD74814.1 hydrolase 1, exosortase A system-associated [Rheinheimera sp.]|tara:strand:+ start:42266 stop:43153 length:888 start_codon:yes stop_codon:yes gene_type:complete